MAGRGARQAAAFARSLLDFLLQADDIPAKTDAQKMAKRILQLREQGRANEVTEEMMAAADPQTMAAYTPLDMSTEARMERAGLLGFNPDEKAYHGALNNPERFSFDEADRPVYTSDNPAVSNTYFYGDGSMFDLLVNQRDGGLDIDAQGNSYNLISPTFKDKNTGIPIADYFDSIDAEHTDELHYVDYKRERGPTVSTDTIANAMEDELQTRARIRNVIDRGPHSPSAIPDGGYSSREAYKKYNDDALKWRDDMQRRSREKSTVQITLDDGGQLRSRFARFDPEFSHLKNLSAAAVPASVGLAQMLQGGEFTKDDIEKYLKSVGAL